MIPSPTCDYRLAGEPGQPQRRCGARAAWVRNGHGGIFHYCDACARIAEDRTRGKLTLSKVREGM